MLEIAHGYLSRFDNAFGSNRPAQGPVLLADRVSQQEQPLHECCWAGRAARHIDVHRHELIHALDHAVDIIHASRVCAGTHGNHPARFHHLVVQTTDDRRHFDKHGACDHHQVRFARRAANHLGAKPGDVVLTGETGRHFDEATRQAEIKRPKRIFPSPGQQVLQLR